MNRHLAPNLRRAHAVPPRARMAIFGASGVVATCVEQGGAVDVDVVVCGGCGRLVYVGHIVSIALTERTLYLVAEEACTPRNVK
jgi:hypothetical protein